MRFIEKLNTLGAVVVVLAIFLVVDGFLFYRYQQQLPTTGDVAAQPSAGIDATTLEETTATAETSSASENAMERTDGAEAFVHRATPETIVDNSTYVDHPSADGNPNAILSVERASESGGDSGDVHNLGVWYDANRRGGRWAVFNQDRAPMSEGTVFDVAVREEPGGNAFVHRATTANTVGNETYIDSPSTNGNSDAVLSVTPNWNPGGETGAYLDHPVGVLYDTEEERWLILNQDLAPMPEGAAFNVVVARP